HEPTTFLTALRPETETRIIPSTWRDPGIGAFGTIGGFEYRAYAMTSLDGEEFGAGGLRGGRQNGNRSAADDFAFVGRLDWTETPGLIVGASLFHGDTGQDGVDGAGNRIPALDTTIVDVHASWQSGPWTLRALYAHAFLDDTDEFNANTGENLAKEMNGWYVEGGFDVLAQWAPQSGQSLSPYLRYEEVDTQRKLESGFMPEAGRDERIITFGVNYKPIPQVVVKADYQDFDEAGDAFNILFGYAF